MKIAFVIAVILLFFACVGCFLLARLLKTLLTSLKMEDEFEEELAFTQGIIDIPEERIAQKFEDAILLCHVEQKPLDYNITKIVDTSNYMKNHVIGLTYFVHPQMFQELKYYIDDDQIRERMRSAILERLPDDEEIDEDFINELINRAMEKLAEDGEYQIDEEYGTMTRPLLPHCTVYQLKDGRWLWRQEEE